MYTHNKCRKVTLNDKLYRPYSVRRAVWVLGKLQYPDNNACSLLIVGNQVNKVTASAVLTVSVQRSYITRNKKKYNFHSLNVLRHYMIKYGT